VLKTKQVKLFTGIISNVVQEGKEFNPLQDAINDWLRANPNITVLSIQATSLPPVRGGSQSTVVILYEE